jgi:DNA-binding IclR family transcriptional regulator
MERSKADSFTAYLQEKQRLDRAKQPVAQTTGGTALSVLGALAAAAAERMTLVELQAASGMTFGDFAEAIKRLQASGYLTVSGGAGSETAELTRLGEDVAKLSDPV